LKLSQSKPPNLFKSFKMKSSVYSLLAIAAAASAGVSTVYETEVKTITSCEPYVTEYVLAVPTVSKLH
jgi:hypothetical protein